MAQENRKRTPACATQKIGLGRWMGFTRQRVAYECDPRATDTPDPTADLFLNYSLYELELANFAAIPIFPEPEEPVPANLT